MPVLAGSEFGGCNEISLAPESTPTPPPRSWGMADVIARVRRGHAHQRSGRTRQLRYRCGMIVGVSTTTKTIERPDVREDTSTNDDTPKFFHYVKKNQILDSAVNGKYVVALCGETFPVTKQAKPGSPVCPDCERVYKSLRRR